MKDALEKRYGQEVVNRSPILLWPVRRAARLVARYQVGGGGRTACGRWKGKQHKKELAESRECVHLRRSAATTKPAKLEAKWEDGV